MNELLLPAVLAVALLGPVSTATAGTQPCGLAKTDRLVLARLEPVRPMFAETGPAAALAEPVGSNAEVETYIRLHFDAAAGDARSRLMPWPELRSLAH